MLLRRPACHTYCANQGQTIQRMKKIHLMQQYYLLWNPEKIQSVRMWGSVCSLALQEWGLFPDEIKVFTDAKGLKGLYVGEIGKIENSRLQAMMEKLMPYNLNFLHVPGKEN